MSVSAPSRRTCRTCPAVISEHGDTGQCRPCQQRSEVVRAVVREQPAALVALPKRAGPPKPRTCEQDGHHACPHFSEIFRVLKQFIDDSDECWVCGGQYVGDVLKHANGCAYQAIEPGAPTAAGRATQDGGL